MAIDASIALGVRPPQIESPMNVLAQSMQLQGAQSTNALNMLKLQELKRGVDDDAAMRTALSAPDADPYKVLLGRNKVKEATEYAKGQSEIAHQKSQMKQADATTAKTELETTFQKFAHAGSVLSQVKDESSYATARGMLNSQLGMNLPAQYDPGLVQATIAQGQTVTERLKAEHERLTLAETTQHNRTTETNAAGQLTETRRHNTTEEGLRRDTLKKDYAVAGINPDGTNADGGGLLSPESVANAAARYNLDGTLPPNLGRGTQGPRQTAQILNEAARMAAARGDSPESQRIQQLANKSSAQALSKLETQQNMVGAFEKNFIKNADIAQELSSKVDRTGVPLVNKWVNAGRRSVTGDPDLAAFDASVKATVNEYAKIVGGGTGSSATAQGEIAKIEGLLSAAQTPQQVTSVLNLMRRETANRMTSFEDQKTELKASMAPKTRPTAAPAATPASGAPGIPPGWSVRAH